jgi:hypothetical protein
MNIAGLVDDLCCKLQFDSAHGGLEFSDSIAIDSAMDW